MRALVTAVGTRGDVQPALALALELRQLGHAVRLCISPNFVDWAKSLGLEAVPMGVEMRMPARRHRCGTDANARRAAAAARIDAGSHHRSVRDHRRRRRGCDVIVGANAHQYAAPSIAEHVGHRLCDGGLRPGRAAVARPRAAAGAGSGRGAGGACSIDGAVARTPRKSGTSARSSGSTTIAGGSAWTPIDDVLDYVLTDHTWLAADAALAPVPATPGAQDLPDGRVGARRSHAASRGSRSVSREAGSRPFSSASAACPLRRVSAVS